MTPEVEKKRRELFEGIMSQKYSAAIGWHERDENGYLMATIRDQWIGFNAALDAVEIVFPNQRDEKYQDYYDDVEGGSFNYSRYLNDVRNAITATGLGLRIK